jgi:alkanesulfonate monooxygenase SsuD/methylene tetrahydromethanopterin reductase-like flavin-dependent oxidoreductase (luciferase family)
MAAMRAAAASPIWFTANNPPGARLAGERGYRSAAFLTGVVVKDTFAAYREAYQAKWGAPADPDRLAYLGMMAVARTKEERERRIQAMRAYLGSIARMRAPHAVPPGYNSVDDFVRQMRTPRKAIALSGFASMTDQDLADAGIMFWGEPQQIYDQVRKFHEAVGGFGHLLIMGQSATMSPKDVRDSLTQFGEHVLPELAKIDKFNTGTQHEAALS